MHDADTVGVYAPTTHHQETNLYIALPAGLSSRYKHGLIYCTPCTAGLVHALLDVPEGILRTLELDTDYFIAGCTVTAMDANHSPGSCMFVIETPPTGEVGAWLPCTVEAFWVVIVMRLLSCSHHTPSKLIVNGLVPE